MLTIEQCRELLGGAAPETDADVEALRDLVAIMAEGVLDSIPGERQEGPKKGEEERSARLETPP